MGKRRSIFLKEGGGTVLPKKILIGVVSKKKKGGIALCTSRLVRARVKKKKKGILSGGEGWPRGGEAAIEKDMSTGRRC